MEERVWRIFYVVPLQPPAQDTEALAPRIRTLSRCRTASDTGFSVVTSRYVVQLLEAPADTLACLIDELAVSDSARLLMSEESPYRWFGASLGGEMSDPQIDRALDEILAAPENRPDGSLLSALADGVARRLKEIERSAPRSAVAVDIAIA